VVKESLVTIAIPTFNRGHRLAIALQQILMEINRYSLNREINIVISDNNSSDNTEEVCLKFKELFAISGINFIMYKNEKNLGFSINVLESYFRANASYTLFFSDDDNLESGFLKQLLLDIKKYQFSVGVYNFCQEPHGVRNLLIKESCVLSGESAFEGLCLLVSWPKLSGLVLRNDHQRERYKKISDLITKENIVGHVVLAIEQIRSESTLFLSETIAAYPDQDFREHVNFVSYIGNYIKRDLEIYCSKIGIDNKKLLQSIDEIPYRNVVQYSLISLSLFYRSKSRLTRTMKLELESNIMRFLMRKKFSKSGLILENPFQSLARMKTALYALFIALLAVKAIISRKKLYLMNEGF
jgi:glycosyltransferase involved in cell wall biosynthesis